MTAFLDDRCIVLLFFCQQLPSVFELWLLPGGNDGRCRTNVCSLNRQRGLGFSTHAHNLITILPQASIRIPVRPHTPGIVVRLCDATLSHASHSCWSCKLQLMNIANWKLQPGSTPSILITLSHPRQEYVEDWCQEMADLARLVKASAGCRLQAESPARHIMLLPP